MPKPLNLPWSIKYQKLFKEWHDKSMPRITNSKGETILVPRQFVNHPGAYDTEANEICETIITQINKTQWINTKHKLPEMSTKITDDLQKASGESDKLLVLLEGTIVANARYYANFGTWSIPGFHGDWKPSHWMPSPELPEDYQE